MPKLDTKIYTLLTKRPGLSAKDIAKSLGVTRTYVNSYLYNHPELFTKQGDSPPLWFIISAPHADPVLSKLQNRENAKKFTLEEFLSIADWSYSESPSEQIAYAYKTRTGNLIECDSKSELIMLSYLEDNDLVLALGGQNLSIPYDSAFRSGLTYHPDIVALTKDNHIAIIEIKPATAMDYHKNVEKYGALQTYCLQKGYIYGMIDPQFEFISYEEIRDMAVPRGLLDMFKQWHSQSNNNHSVKFFNKSDVDQWYAQYGSSYSRKEFDLHVHSLIIYYGWYNCYKNGFLVYSRPVKVNQNHDIVEVL